ncbi:MAG: Response regulator MprA [Elusimicrobia bacterium]|nr:Response regulator MprA [Elusimicrobiota bacterium]
MKVLLVEDDRDVSETIVTVLNGFFKDVEIQHIADGTQFRGGSWKIPGWNLVILDLMMPGITGFEVCEHLRSFPATKKVPILALTGYDTLQNEEKIISAGATGYMAKPFEVMKLKDEIERILKK